MALLENSKWFHGPDHKPVMTADGLTFVPIKSDVQQAILEYPRPRVLAFSPRQKTELDQVLDEVKANAHEIEDIVVLYRSKKGGYFTVSNQGDTAGNLLFIEKAKMRFLQDDKPPGGSQAG